MSPCFIAPMKVGARYIHTELFVRIKVFIFPLVIFGSKMGGLQY